MTSLHCLDCNGVDIIPGESGRPSECRICGSKNLGGVYATTAFKALEQHSPLESSFKVIKRAGVDAARAHVLFEEIHKLIDAA